VQPGRATSSTRMQRPTFLLAVSYVVRSIGTDTADAECGTGGVYSYTAAGFVPTTCFASNNTCVVPGRPPEFGDRCHLSYMPAEVHAVSAVPLVIDLHPRTVDMWAQFNSYGQRLYRLALEEGFAVVWPEGTETSWEGYSTISWNAGPSTGSHCCAPGVDDTAYVTSLIEYYLALYPFLDPAQVYLTGHSNGCMLASYLPTQASGLVAGVACATGYLMSAFAGSFAADYVPVPYLEMHGRIDETIPYTTGDPGALDNLANYGAANGCAPLPTPAWSKPFSAYLEYGRNCTAPAALLTLYAAGHVPYYNPANIDLHAYAWQWLQEHRRPLSPAVPAPSDRLAALLGALSAARKKASRLVALSSLREAEATGSARERYADSTLQRLARLFLWVSGLWRLLVAVTLELLSAFAWETGLAQLWT